MSLSRLSQTIAPRVTRAGVVALATRSFCSPAPILRSQQQQQRSQQTASSSSFRGLAAGILALLSGGVAIAACEQVVEQKKGGNVDYVKLRAELEQLIESAEGSDIHTHTRERDSAVDKDKWQQE